MEKVLTAIGLRDFGFVPYALATIGRAPVECISYPFPREDGTFGIMVRVTPGDPGSLIEATVPMVAVDLVRAVQLSPLD